MKNAPIQIRNDAAVRSIRALSALTGVPITEAVARAVNERLEREQRTKTSEWERKHRLVREIVESVKLLPIVGPILTDDDLYDEDGMPK